MVDGGGGGRPMGKAQKQIERERVPFSGMDG